MTPTTCALAHLDADVRTSLADCWVAVTRAGGAAGFPRRDTPAERIGEAVEEIGTVLDTGRSRVVVAEDDGELVGWVLVEGNVAPQAAHWATIRHLQTRPDRRNQGLGRALMRAAHGTAREELHLERLRLSVRDGEGLEPFYRGLGWETVGRFPAALRMGPGDTRDEVLMTVHL